MTADIHQVSLDTTQEAPSVFRCQVTLPGPFRQGYLTVTPHPTLSRSAGPADRGLALRGMCWVTLGRWLPLSGPQFSPL